MSFLHWLQIIKWNSCKYKIAKLTINTEYRIWVVKIRYKLLNVLILLSMFYFFKSIIPFWWDNPYFVVPTVSMRLNLLDLLFQNTVICAYTWTTSYEVSAMHRPLLELSCQQCWQSWLWIDQLLSSEILTRIIWCDIVARYNLFPTCWPAINLLAVKNCSNISYCSRILMACSSTWSFFSLLMIICPWK